MILVGQVEPMRTQRTALKFNRSWPMTPPGAHLSVVLAPSRGQLDG